MGMSWLACAFARRIDRNSDISSSLRHPHRTQFAKRPDPIHRWRLVDESSIESRLPKRFLENFGIGGRWHSRPKIIRRYKRMRTTRDAATTSTLNLEDHHNDETGFSGAQAGAEFVERFWGGPMRRFVHTNPGIGVAQKLVGIAVALQGAQAQPGPRGRPIGGALDDLFPSDE